VNVVQGRHNASIGFYGFAQHDNTLFGLNGTSFDDSTDPPTPALVNVPLTRQKVDGDLEAVWIQDQYKASSWLSLTAGVRFTRFSGLVTETAGSPRLGVAIQIPHLHWVLRGAYVPDVIPDGHHQLAVFLPEPAIGDEALTLAVGVLVGSGFAHWLQIHGVTLSEQLTARMGTAFPMKNTFYAQLTPGIVVAGLALGLVIAVVGAFLPALRASSIQPVSAMQSKR
jgi:hypothetical protein